VDADGVQAVRAQAPKPAAADPAQIQFLSHEFPIRGPHYYGENAARFGGGRGHQGHDTFAACGTPLVAARGGVVKFKQYHSAAGHYIVIDGVRTGIDYTYMHLRDAALVNAGDRVRTGQLIGYVGQTGRTSGCHLHFEMWNAPGWYDGGKPFDPLPSLLAWDRTS
jgi:murein DD-endopeptidase MepM/ murein hydrolase activator NlpD